MGKTGRFWSEDGEAAYRRTYEAARALWPVHEVRLIPCRSTTGVASPVPVVSAWTVPNCVVRRLDRRRAGAARAGAGGVGHAAGARGHHPTRGVPGSG